MNSLLKQICGLPTAPFCEQAVIAFVRAFCRKHRLDLKEDRHGNLLVTAVNGSPRWVLVAHMDHPGMQVSAGSEKGKVRARFRGGVLAECIGKAPVAFYGDGGAVRGKVLSVTAGESGGATEVEARVRGDVPEGALGMFDLAVAKQRGELLYSRALDDLAGVAAALEAILRVKASRKRAGGFAALLTRGEEEGFVGAIAAARDGELLRKSDRIISIECSARQPVAVQGKGVIIRVGDKTSVFDSAATWQLVQTAEELAKRSKRFAFQRALMPGGTCEATAFSLYGYRAAAVCVALGNYHNMDREKKRIGPEFIHLGDWENLVRLLAALAAEKPLNDLRPLQRKLEKRFKGLAHLLK